MNRQDNIANYTIGNCQLSIVNCQLAIDPLWEKYYGWTPYHYTRNNPICRVDFNGMDDGQFGSWMQVGPIQQQILGEDMVKTYQDVVKYSDKPENKELVNTWAEIGIMGLTGIGTEAALATKVATKYLSKAGNLLKGLIGFGDEAAKEVLKSFDDVVANPKALLGKSADEVGSILGEGWTKGSYGSKGEGWKFIKGDKSIFYHPGGGRHVGSYYGFSSGQLGRNKIVGTDYMPIIGDKANIINIGK